MITFALGVVSGIVLVQLYPRSALVGTWIIKRGYALISGRNDA